jgi:phosphoribosyl 1,2-cyclic phosphodiesterase
VRLDVLGSGSRGNAFAVTAGGVTILLDAGFGPKILRKRAEAAGFDFSNLIGIVLTHEHGDHSRGASSTSKKTGCPIYASRGTLSALSHRLSERTTVPLPAHEPTAIGPFTVTTCPTMHDALEPVGIKVVGPDGDATLCLVYDLGRPTTALRFMMQEANCLLLEANHDELMLRMGPYPPVVRDRIGGSRGHLSNRAAGQLLAEVIHPGLANVVLVHLSERCNTAELAEEQVRREIQGRGFGGNILVAKQEAPLEPLKIAADAKQLELGLTR